MAAVVHISGSPKQNQISTHFQYKNGTPKYTKSAQHVNMSNRHQNFVGSNHKSGHRQLNSAYSPIAYEPVGNNVHYQTFGLRQRSSTEVACLNYWPCNGSTSAYRGKHHSNRKSAVEILAETKPLFIKSDDRLQQSNCCMKCVRNKFENRDKGRRNSSYDKAFPTDFGQGFPASTYVIQNNKSAPTYNQHSHQLRVGSNSNNLMQSKLRTLVSSETLEEFDNTVRRTNSRLNNQQHKYNSDIPKVTFCNSRRFGSPHHGTLNLSSQSLLSPQSNEDLHNYGMDKINSDEPLVLTENYRPISPPAEYAADVQPSSTEQRSRYHYHRSYSHSNEMAKGEESYPDPALNINSHKSLPDLHLQMNRHSPHSEILSCCSRGNRSVKSAGESSLNRDSGGSSGHYTHRSEPCYRQLENDRETYRSRNCRKPVSVEYRRDSGSSTQHSVNSYCGYVSSSLHRVNNCNECQSENVTYCAPADYSLNFTTPEVPEAFQDSYSPPPVVAKPNELRYSYFSNQLNIAPNNKIFELPPADDISPPPIQFKRQKCIRFKNRKKIIFSGAPTQNITATYDRKENQAFCFSKQFPDNNYHNYKPETSHNKTLEDNIKLQTYDATYSAEVEVLTDLENFFDRLGLGFDLFNEIYSPLIKRRNPASDSSDSSTVFFSDVSTVDSMRLPDSTETQRSIAQTYRSSEPLSIVERNARIIKWLCNCRK